MSRAGLFLLLTLPTLAAQAAPPLDLQGDPLPSGAIARLGTVRLWHGAAIHQLQFFPDGKTLASLGEDGTIRIWDVTTGRQVRVIGKGMRTFALSPDGKSLAAAVVSEGAQVIRLWETATGREVATLNGGPKMEVLHLVFSPDGRLLASCGGLGREVHVWDLSAQQKLGDYQAGGMFPQLAFSANSRLLAVLSQGTVSLWDLEREQAWPLEQGSAQMEQMAAVPKSSHLVTVDSRGSVRCWDFTTGKQARPGVTYVDTPHRLGSASAFSANARFLAITRESRQIAVWDLESGKRLQSLRLRHRDFPVLAISPDGNMLATEEDCAIRLWDVRTGQEHLPLAGHRARVEQLVYLNGHTLASANGKETVRLWDISSGKQLATRPGGILMQDGSAVARADWETMVRLEDTTTGKLTCLFQEHRHRVRDLAFSSCGEKMASLDEGNVIYLWERSTGKPLHCLCRSDYMAALRGTWHWLSFSADGKTLLAKGQTWLLFHFALWDTATGRLLQSSDNDGFWIISPDSKVLAEIDHEGSEGAVVLKDVQTGKELRRLPWDQPSWQPWALSFSPDGRLVTAPAKGEFGLRMFEVATGRLVHQLRGTATTRAAFSGDGRNLVTLGSDQTIQVWEVASGKERRRFRDHGGDVCCLEFSPDGRTLATGGNDSTILIWDLTGLPAEKRKLSAQELQAAWDDLGSPDAVRAYRAVWRLAEAAEQSVPLLRRRLQNVPGPDPRLLKMLLQDLDNDDFAAREKAHQQLQRLGVLAESALRQELADGPSAEVRQRIRRLLAGITHYAFTPEQLRQRRAVEVLEYAGSAEARQLLRLLAEGTAVPLHQEARAALERMARGQPIARQ